MACKRVSTTCGPPPYPRGSGGRAERGYFRGVNDGINANASDVADVDPQDPSVGGRYTWNSLDPSTYTLESFVKKFQIHIVSGGGGGGCAGRTQSFDTFAGGNGGYGGGSTYAALWITNAQAVKDVLIQSTGDRGLGGTFFIDTGNNTTGGNGGDASVYVTFQNYTILGERERDVTKLRSFVRVAYDLTGPQSKYTVRLTVDAQYGSISHFLLGLSLEFYAPPGTTATALADYITSTGGDIANFSGKVYSSGTSSVETTGAQQMLGGAEPVTVTTYGGYGGEMGNVGDPGVDGRYGAGGGYRIHQANVGDIFKVVPYSQYDGSRLQIFVMGEKTGASAWNAHFADQDGVTAGYVVAFTSSGQRGPIKKAAFDDSGLSLVLGEHYRVPEDSDEYWIGFGGPGSSHVVLPYTGPTPPSWWPRDGGLGAKGFVGITVLKDEFFVKDVDAEEPEPYLPFDYTPKAQTHTTVASGEIVLNNHYSFYNQTGPLTGTYDIWLQPLNTRGFYVISTDENTTITATFKDGENRKINGTAALKTYTIDPGKIVIVTWTGVEWILTGGIV